MQGLYYHPQTIPSHMSANNHYQQFRLKAREEIINAFQHFKLVPSSVVSIKARVTLTKIKRSNEIFHSWNESRYMNSILYILRMSHEGGEWRSIRLVVMSVRLWTFKLKTGTANPWDGTLVLWLTILAWLL